MRFRLNIPNPYKFETSSNTSPILFIFYFYLPSFHFEEGMYLIKFQIYNAKRYLLKTLKVRDEINSKLNYLF